jgi:hypothetical protein
MTFELATHPTHRQETRKQSHSDQYPTSPFVPSSLLHSSGIGETHLRKFLLHHMVFLESDPKEGLVDGLVKVQ